MANSTFGTVLMSVATGIMIKEMYDKNRDLVPIVTTLSLMIGLTLMVRSSKSEKAY